MTIRRTNPSGKLIVIDEFKESSSGHYDKTTLVSLEPGQNGSVLLTEYVDECDQFKGPRSEKTQSWEIDAELLVNFIKSNVKVAIKT